MGQNMGNRVVTEILKTTLKYKIPLFLCIFIMMKFFWTMKNQHDIFFRHTDLYSALEIIGNIFLVIIFFINIAFVRYKSATGRNLFMDKFQYGRSYFELMKYFHDADRHSMDISSLEEKPWYKSNGIILGKRNKQLIELPATSQKNIALFGIPKSGKTVTLISTCLQYDGSIFAIDIKGDIYDKTKGKRNIKVFAPASPEISMLYNPLSGIVDLDIDEKKRLLTSIAMILIPDQPSSSDGQYFVKGARSFFTGISLYIIERDMLADFPYIIQSILNGNAKQYVEEIRKSDCEAAQSYTNSFYGENIKNVAGCYAALCDALRPFNSKALFSLLKGYNTDSSKSYITPDTLEEGYDIYLQIKQSDLELYAPLLALITQQFINAFKDRNEAANPPILMVLDEFPQLRKMDGISTAMATLRSKNITLLLAMQSIAQLDKWYGEAGRKEIIDCCATLLFFKIQDTETRKWAAEFIGTRKVLKASNSLDKNKLQRKNKSYSESREAIFQPEDFGDLGDGKVLVCNGGKYVLADIVKYYEDL